jgi:hypothetical protein
MSSRHLLIYLRSLRVKMKEKTWRKLKEFQISIPSMEIQDLTPNQIILLPVASLLWATSTISSSSVSSIS